ncbi:MAG TPA: hypothetical protein VGM67_02755 [Gemmatimonadaceae bacterium]
MAVPIVARDDLGQISLFYEQFAHIEPVALVLVALFAVAAFASTFGIPALSSDADRRLSETGDASRARSRLVLWTAVAFAFVVVLVGFFVVFEHFYLIDDEYSAWFQAVIFAAGKLHGAVPAEWCGWIGALTPTSVTPHPSSCTWELSFLPLHSLYRSLFLIVHADWLAGPVTAALTIALVASTARKLWPNRPERAWIAVVVLATSMQFLFMSMTMYSMPTHLLCSALWLWLYVDNRRWSIAALPFVGFIALGVHSPIPHGLWIAAFLLRFVRDRRWGVALYVGVGYALALSFWAGHLEIARSVSGSVAGMASGSATVHAVRAPFGFPNALARMTTVMNLALVATWNAPIALLCVIVAALSWRSLDTTSRDLVLSLGVIVVARAVSAPLQGGGWGYRSIYDGMSNIALLAACGVDVMASSIGRRRALGLFAASTAAAVIVQLPLRARQVHAIVAPYARTYRWMTQLPAKVVLFDSEDAMWGSMLLRNDPFLRNSPVLALEYVFTPAGIQDLERRYPGGVHVVTRAELLHLGLEAAPPRIGGSRLP